MPRCPLRWRCAAWRYPTTPWRPSCSPASPTVRHLVSHTAAGLQCWGHPCLCTSAPVWTATSAPHHYAQRAAWCRSMLASSSLLCVRAVERSVCAVMVDFIHDAGKFFWYTFFIWLVLNTMTFYGKLPADDKVLPQSLAACHLLPLLACALPAAAVDHICKGRLRLPSDSFPCCNLHSADTWQRLQLCSWLCVASCCSASACTCRD